MNVTDQQTHKSYSNAYLNLVKSSRNLMAQLAYLTNLYFIAVFSGYGNDQAIAEKLYQLPFRFRERIELVFGEPLAREYLDLTSFHSMYTQLLAEALVNKDTEAADYYTQLLYKNAAQLAAYYAKINPFWEEARWRTLLYNYIYLVIQNAIALSLGDFDKSLEIFERALIEALNMGEYFADGLYEYMIISKMPPPKEDMAP